MFKGRKPRKRNSENIEFLEAGRGEEFAKAFESRKSRSISVAFLVEGAVYSQGSICGCDFGGEPPGSCPRLSTSCWFVALVGAIHSTTAKPSGHRPRSDSRARDLGA